MMRQLVRGRAEDVGQDDDRPAAGAARTHDP